jgi:hypothetical protein
VLSDDPKILRPIRTQQEMKSVCSQETIGSDRDWGGQRALAISKGRKGSHLKIIKNSSWRMGDETV